MLSKGESPLIEGDGRVDGDCIGEGGMDVGMVEGVDRGKVSVPYI